MKCLFLCRRLAGYFYDCIQVLADADPELEILIVAYPRADNAPFQFANHPRIQIIGRQDKGESELQAFLKTQRPNYIYVAGWADKLYNQICKHFKGTVPVTMGMDNQWKALWRQYLLAYVLRFKIHAMCDRIWVPGMYQYEYARRLGFAREAIDTGLYAADPEKFIELDRSSQQAGEKCLLFIGNMWADKGVVELVEAFKAVQSEHPDWRLLLIGGGPLIETYQGAIDSVEVLGFVQPDELPTVMARASAFCLPSYHDAWAVVIHEAASMGLPIIATDVCGAVSAFVHEGYNGFRCKPRDQESLKHALLQLMELPDGDRDEYGRRSRSLSFQFTPALWAARVLTRLRAEG